MLLKGRQGKYSRKPIPYLAIYGVLKIIAATTTLARSFNFQMAVLYGHRSIASNGI